MLMFLLQKEELSAFTPPDLIYNPLRFSFFVAPESLRILIQMV